MLTEVADGVSIHQSGFCRTNAVVVHGDSGVLVVDAGVTRTELACLAGDLAGVTIAAGFSTHPHWDHLLWHESLGAGVPRYATARAAATVRERLPDAAAKSRATAMMPPDLVDQVPLDLLGDVTGLPSGTEAIPWDGPEVRIVEHQAHASGHAALLIADRRVLVAGDMLSDVLIPILDGGGVDPVGDYLAALDRLEGVVGDVDVVVPGHGSVASGADARARIEADRAYVLSLRDTAQSDDRRIGTDAEDGWEWVAGVHERQLQNLAR